MGASARNRGGTECGSHPTVTSPRFSIVVPAYEAGSTLVETLDAILSQTWADWECVVVDDGSMDGTLRIAASFEQKDARVRAIHQVNSGTAGAYNTGVSSAAGDYVVLCSADDILLPHHLATMSAFIDAEPGFDIYSSNGYFWVPGASKELVYGPAILTTVCSLELRDVIHRCFYSVGALYRRELFAAVGGYRIGVFGEDYDFWLRSMATGARHRYLPKALSLHRISATQKSASLEAVFQSDIRLVSDLDRDFALAPADRQAVADAIRERQRLIIEVKRSQALPRRVTKMIAFRLLGRRRTARVASTVRSLAKRLRR